MKHLKIFEAYFSHNKLSYELINDNQLRDFHDGRIKVTKTETGTSYSDEDYKISPNEKLELEDIFKCEFRITSWPSRLERVKVKDANFYDNFGKWVINEVWKYYDDYYVLFLSISEHGTKGSFSTKQIKVLCDQLDGVEDFAKDYNML